MCRRLAAISTGGSTGIGAARVRRWALRPWQARRSAARLNYRPQNWATTRRARTRSTQWRPGTLCASSSLSAACSPSNSRGSRKRWCCGRRGSSSGWNSTTAIAPAVRSCRRRKNPDRGELRGGKAGRLIGNLVGMLSVLKSLPLAYNRDLAEDKSAAFDSIDTLSLVLPALAAMIRTMRIDVERLRRQAPLGFTLATEVADWLALSGVPFSEAHEITGALVQAWEARGIELSAASQALLAQVDARLPPAVLQHLTLDAAIGARTGYGGTAPQRVSEQIARAQAALARQGEWTHGAYAGPRC